MGVGPCLVLLAVAEPASQRATQTPLSWVRTSKGVVLLPPWAEGLAPGGGRVALGHRLPPSHRTGAGAGLRPAAGRCLLLPSCRQLNSWQLPTGPAPLLPGGGSLRGTAELAVQLGCARGVFCTCLCAAKVGGRSLSQHLGTAFLVIHAEGCQPSGVLRATLLLSGAGTGLWQRAPPGR